MVAEVDRLIWIDLEMTGLDTNRDSIIEIASIVTDANLDVIAEGPVVAIKLEGERVVEGFRSLAGATDPTVAAPGTIRGDLSRDWGTKVIQNLVHGSDSEETAKRELEIWF